MPDGAPSSGAPLLRIRAGIEAGNPAEVMAGVKDAETQGVTLAPNVRDMITQWLAVNPLPAAKESVSVVIDEPRPAAAAAPKVAPLPAKPAGGSDEDVRVGDGQAGWSKTEGRPAAAASAAVSPAAAAAQTPQQTQPGKPKLTADTLRIALLKFFSGAPKGSDAALGLNIVEGDNGDRFFPLGLLGKAVGLEGEDHVRGVLVMKCIHEAMSGVFVFSPDGRGAGLVEWPGWEEFSTALEQIVTATRDPAFEPRSIQEPVKKIANGAVRAGGSRQADVLRSISEKLSPSDMPADAAPALRSAISRRTRLALACVVDAIAARGLGPDAGPDSMGLVGQLPRTLLGLIFDNIDDRDRGACAFLGELLNSWDRRRCFSKRWVQTAAAKFQMPKGANSERDEGRGWYALTAENLGKKAPEAKAEDNAPPEPKDRRQDRSRSRTRERKPDDSKSKRAPKTAAAADVAEEEAAAAAKSKRLKDDEEDDDAVNRKLEESRKRRAALMEKHKK